MSVVGGKAMKLNVILPVFVLSALIAAIPLLFLDELEPALLCAILAAGMLLMAKQGNWEMVRKHSNAPFLHQYCHHRSIWLGVALVAGISSLMRGQYWIALVIGACFILMTIDVLRTGRRWARSRVQFKHY